ncbi:MAG: helix-turn-helix transcriptional regulator [Firmicutes bacterium]|nr:helix-turn-helix transcriptional regulator [Bacillota bacterium]
MSVGNNLRLLRAAKGLTQEQVAVQLGVTRQALSGYESGRTMPDVEMLQRLAEIYGTDLDGIVYGRDEDIIITNRTVKTAKILFAVLAVMTAVSSAFLWAANVLFPVSAGQMSAIEKEALQYHFRLTNAWELTDNVILILSLVGFIALLLMLSSGKCRVPLRKKLIYMAALAGTMIVIAAIFGAADPVFNIVDYVMTPLMVAARMVVLFAIGLLIEAFHKRKKEE